MPNDPEDRKRSLTRVRRIRGQCEGLERALEAGEDCAPILQQIAAVRGAVNGLMAEILEIHIREAFVQPGSAPGDAADPRMQDLLELVRRYMK